MLPTKLYVNFHRGLALLSPFFFIGALVNFRIVKGKRNKVRWEKKAHGLSLGSWFVLCKDRFSHFATSDTLPSRHVQKVRVHLICSFFLLSPSILFGRKLVRKEKKSECFGMFNGEIYQKVDAKRTVAAAVRSAREEKR